jgi:Acetyltransferase (GNAT) domain
MEGEAVGAVASGPDPAVRPASAADDDAVLALLHDALGWVPDADHASFFSWKHRDNVFGPSPAWVGLDDKTGDVVAYRTFMRWEFVVDGEVVRAVRAVDTATHSSQRGKGWFTRLTMHALEELRGDGVGFVFNTPNDASRPGYLKMGWLPVGKVPVAVRPRSPRSLLRTARARTAADKWSLATGGGEPAADVLSDGAGVDALLDSLPPVRQGVATRRSPSYLAWRYGFGPLHYRVVLAGADVTDGLAVFRLRRRGEALEAAVCELLVPGGDAAARRHLLAQVGRLSGADHALVVADHRRRSGAVPVPGLGPQLVWRDVCRSGPPPLPSWRLTLGDVELF